MPGYRQYFLLTAGKLPLRDLKRKATYVTLIFLAALALPAFRSSETGSDTILSYTANPGKQELKLYWKDEKGQILGSLLRLKQFVESGGKKLVFAANAGMYMENQAPLGLFIQEQKTMRRLNIANGSGNFYLKPNGVFYLSSGRQAGICTTEEFPGRKPVSYATQSGPMLLINGEIHPAFTKGSANLNIRNGVGILPDSSVIFAMSKQPLNFYDFAMFFKQKGCKQALYLDGFVSRTYLPEKNWIQTDGNFGVMIGITEPGGKTH